MVSRCIILILLITALPVVADQSVRCRCTPEGCVVPYIACRRPVDTPTARELLTFAERALQAAFPGRFGLDQPVEIVAVPPWELRRVGGEPVLGYWDEKRIWISEELYPSQALAVVAHEYAHVWHFQNHPDPDGMSDPLVEGFAEWVAHKVQQRAGNLGECDRIATNTDPVYGGGFRWFRDLERDFGQDVVFQIALTWLDFQGRKVVEVDPPTRSGNARRR